MSDVYNLKPNKTAFVTYRFIRLFISSLLIFIILAIAGSLFLGISVLYFVIVFVLFETLMYYVLTVRYLKEKYVFLGNRIVHKSGGIFSEKETELVIRNITHVILRLPFIENSLFKTGNVLIESAGSGAAEIYFSSIENPEEFYEYIRKLMEYNGFKLSKGQHVQQERPEVIGVFFEVFKKFIGTIFTILFLGLYVGVPFENLLDFVEGNITIALPVFVLVLSVLFIRSIFQFLDLKNRVYDIYSDTITYSEGFLTKNYCFIPMENLADSTITQTLIDKIFGLYDVTLSCQGTKQEILFKNMVNGPKLESTLDSLIHKSKPLVGLEEQPTVEAGVQKQAGYKTGHLHKDTGFTAEYRMDGKRTVIPLLIYFPVCLIFFPLLLPWFIMFVSGIIGISATRYAVKSTSMEERYNFISSRKKEFTNDKITGVIFKENFIDKWFNTCSIHFWSIGSSEDIKFTNIKKSDGLYESIVAKLGVGPQEKLYQVDSSFNIAEMLKATLFLTLFSAALLAGSLFGMFLFSPFLILPLIVVPLLYVVTIVYRTAYYGNSKLMFFKDYIYFTRGLFFKEFYYVLYDNVKDITTVQYPFSGFGLIRFNVAGEHIVQQGKNKSVVSNNFTINYVKDIETKDELIDLIFFQRPDAQSISRIEQDVRSYSPEPVIVSRPDVANSLVGLFIFSVILFPLIVLLPFTVPLIIWSVRVKSFSIQPYRVVAASGILYRKQTSVIFSKIDHLNVSQGMFNKMFNNGTVTVNTIGSSSAELIVKNIPDFKNFHNILKKHY